MCLYLRDKVESIVTSNIYIYASDTLKLLRTLPINEFFNYMMNK